MIMMVGSRGKIQVWNRSQSKNTRGEVKLGKFVLYTQWPGSHLFLLAHLSMVIEGYVNIKSFHLFLMYEPLLQAYILLRSIFLHTIRRYSPDNNKRVRIYHALRDNQCYVLRCRYLARSYKCAYEPSSTY